VRGNRPPTSTRRAAPHEREERHRGRTPLIVLAAVAVAALFAASVLAVIAFFAPPRTPVSGVSASPAVPVLVPPADVTLDDEGATIKLTWSDPSGGTLPFIVSGGRSGQEAQPYPPLARGATSFTVNGLDAAVDYCFTVVAVYSTDQFAPSDLVCTKRQPDSGSSSSPDPSSS
jgi:hypothetical protein